YCIPHSQDGVRQSGPVIQLGNPRPVLAPYPRIMLVPPLSTLVRLERTILHGFITVQGQFRELKPVRKEDEGFFSRIGSFLKTWEFRPATRDGLPVEVEMLLIIPGFQI
ncbi:MAG: hypothetical protein IT158_09855, partial [Bryobacterales bacterium]|nr:hypothetical protein [Bryobacterales bacterium]